MTAQLPRDHDQYGTILYTCMWNSGMTIMPVGYTDITPEPGARREVQSAVLRPKHRLRHAMSVLFKGTGTIREDELE